MSRRAHSPGQDPSERIAQAQQAQAEARERLRVTRATHAKNVEARLAWLAEVKERIQRTRRENEEAVRAQLARMKERSQAARQGPRRNTTARDGSTGVQPGMRRLK
jgi:hypothetical protein